jgi:hypothetical protein
VIAVVPVTVPVVRDAEGDGFGIALAELRQQLPIERRVAPG